MADVVNNGAVNKTKWGIEADKLNAKFNSIDLEINDNFAKLDIGVDTLIKQKSRFTTFGAVSSSQPIVSFIDDDTSTQVMPNLLPIFQAKEVPCNLAVVSGIIDTVNGMSSADLKTVLAEGWELLGHGHQYTNNLSEFTNWDDIDNDLRTNKKFLESLGSYNSGFVYPQNYYHTLMIRDAVKKHFEFAFGAIGMNSSVSIDTQVIKRIAFGSSWEQNPATVNGVERANSLDYYKACVDYAASNNLWLVFMVHSHIAGFSASILSSLIDYVKSLSIKITTVSEAYADFGNNIFAGDRNESWIAVNKNGFYSNSGTVNTILPVNTVPLAQLITDFNVGKTVCNISNAYATSEGYPDLTAGTLITYRYNKDQPYYNFQTYRIYLTNKTYQRYSKVDGTWSEWEVEEKLLFNLAPNKPLLDTITSYSKGVSIGLITSAFSSTDGYPEGKAGTLTTYRSSTLAGEFVYAWQEFRIISSDMVYRRYPLSDTTWSAFKAVNDSYFYDINSKTPLDSINTYRQGRSVAIINNAFGASEGFPEGGAGTLITYRPDKESGNYGYNYQEYHVYLSNTVYRRYATSPTVWGSWVRISKPRGYTTTQRNALANTYAGEMVFDTTLNKPVWRNAENTGYVDATGVEV